MRVIGCKRNIYTFFQLSSGISHFTWELNSPLLSVCKLSSSQSHSLGCLAKILYYSALGSRGVPCQLNRFWALTCHIHPAPPHAAQMLRKTSPCLRGTSLCQPQHRTISLPLWPPCRTKLEWYLPSDFFLESRRQKHHSRTCSHFHSLSFISLTMKGPCCRRETFFTSYAHSLRSGIWISPFQGLMW